MGRLHAGPISVYGMETGVSVGTEESSGGTGIHFNTDRPISLHGSEITGNDIGIEARSNANLLVQNSRVEGNQVADFAYQEDSFVQLAHVYADRMFDLTSGTFSNVDSDVNFIADQILTSRDPQRVRTLATRLKERLSRVPDWAIDGMKYDAVKEFVRLVIYSQF